MDKYLKQLLEQYAKVILPSFGAIVVENEETGNLMFNEYLSYNDGKLDDLIVNESNMDLQEAQNMIAKYVRDIQVQIDKGESYDIFELGRFYKNDDGDVEFEGNLKNGPKTQSKKEPSKAAVTKDSKSDKKKEEKPKKEEAPKPKEEKKETKEESKKEEPKKVTKKVDSKSKKAVKKESKSETKSTEKENKFVAKKEEVTTKKDKPKEEPKKKAAPVKKEKAPKPAKKKKEKTQKEGEKKKRFGAFFWVAIIILALASAGLIYVGLNYEKVKSYMGWDKFDQKENVASKEELDKPEQDNQETVELDANESNVGDSTETSESEELKEGEALEEEAETEVEPEPKPEPEPEPQPVASVSNGTHHLIAGSFSNISNANNLVEELKGKGLDARILGEFSGLHFVAAASYNSSKEARDDIQRVKQHASGAWIFKYNDK